MWRVGAGRGSWCCGKVCLCFSWGRTARGSVLPWMCCSEPWRPCLGTKSLPAPPFQPPGVHPIPTRPLLTPLGVLLHRLETPPPPPPRPTPLWTPGKKNTPPPGASCPLSRSMAPCCLPGRAVPQKNPLRPRSRGGGGGGGGGDGHKPRGSWLWAGAPPPPKSRGWGKGQQAAWGWP